MTLPARLKRWRAPAFVAALIIAGVLAGVMLRENAAVEPRRVDAARLMNELMSGKTAVGGPFTLIDQHGARRSLHDFRGKLVLLYFGFTYCPDVCPADLMTIGKLVDSFGADGERLQPVFITLDPGRDTREALRSYVASFHPRFVALTGTEEEIRGVATSYKVFFEKVRPPGTNTYFIDHAAFVFLLDREGRFVTVFPPGTPQERMAVMVREQLASQ